MIFFFKQKTAYEIKECDWSSDVCSSDLLIERYKKKRKELYELIEKTPRQKGDAKRIIKEHLLWDYQSILSRDPHLPSEFLPDDWGREKAKSFIETYLEDSTL